MTIKKIKIKTNMPLPGYPEGSVVPVPVDAAGIPINKFWRDRLRDAELDNCVEIVKAPRKTSNKNEEKS